MFRVVYREEAETEFLPTDRWVVFCLALVETDVILSERMWVDSDGVLVCLVWAL